jgi:hypothetical protein
MASAAGWTGSRPGFATTAATDRYRTSALVLTRPGERGSLSDGVVVEATVIGRLLGLKLLRVKAHITLLPAGLEPIVYVDARPARQQAGPGKAGGDLSDAADLLAHASRTMHDAERITL